MSPELIKKIGFNMSQFTGVEDLHHALHQVRDMGLSGKIPLVFFDGFDAALEGQSLGWLRYFLTPMQDGAFLQGQISHPLGTAIFVFAGGTSEKLAASAAICPRRNSARSRAPISFPGSRASSISWVPTPCRPARAAIRISCCAAPSSPLAHFAAGQADRRQARRKRSPEHRPGCP